MIERKDLVEMFEMMQKGGIDTSQEFLWGYFFTDRDPQRLESVVPDLEQAGYRFVAIYEPEYE